MAKTITKYLCEACLREINPKMGILVKGQVRTIQEGDEQPVVIDSKKEDVAYCHLCVKGLLLGEDNILHRARVKNGNI